VSVALAFPIAANDGVRNITVTSTGQRHSLMGRFRYGEFVHKGRRRPATIATAPGYSEESERYPSRRNVVEARRRSSH